MRPDKRVERTQQIMPKGVPDLDIPWDGVRPPWIDLSHREVSDKTHVWVGQFRPTRETLEHYIRWGMDNCRYDCPTGHTSRYRAGWASFALRCWSKGCFDQPVYVTVRELLDPIHKAIIASLDRADQIAQGPK